MNKIVAIHQPNFFPWLGYFDKIARSDIFVFFDDVQFPKTGGSWSNRVKLQIAGEARWLTAAIDRKYSGMRTIREMLFLENIPWREKSLKSIEINYSKHPFYDETMDIVVNLLLNPEPNIAEYNIKAIRTITQLIGLDTKKLYRSSELPQEGSSNELLCSITRTVGGSSYMCGGGASGYQDETVFKNHGVNLTYQNYTHPTYPQRGREDFTAGLSIIDVAMNLGWDGVKELMNKPKC